MQFTHTIKVPAAAATQAMADYVLANPNKETMDNPAWVDPEDGSEADQVAKYTDAEWVVEHSHRMNIRMIKNQINRGERLRLRNASTEVDVTRS